jgi:formate dehydrogenase subunit delta
VSFIDTGRLVTMANQIGEFFAPYPPARRVEGVRNHLRNYWDPRMRAALFDHLDATGGPDLLDHVKEAAAQVRRETAAVRAYAGPPRPGDAPAP